MSRVIMVTSGKGGVGKTTVCANLGITLAKMGHKVCLIDVDLGLKNLDVVMGLENRVLFDLKDAVEGKCNIEKALLRDKRCENLFLLPACKSVNILNFSFADLQMVVEELKKIFDFVILDSPAGIESGFRYCIACCDEVLLITQLDVTAIQDSDRIIGILMKENIKNIRIIINRLNPTFIQKGISLNVKEAMDWLSLELLGVIYEDEWLIAGNNRGIPRVLDENCLTHECYQVIGKRLLGEKAITPKYHEKSLLQRIFVR